MKDESTPRSVKPTGNIKFSSYNLPTLDDGLYKISVEHAFQADAKQAGAHNEPLSIPAQTRYFAAVGPQYALDPSEVSMRFPPPGTSGQYYDVLPHIMFKRAILPWERRFDQDSAHIPWLTLISMTHSEITDWQTATGDRKLLTVRTGSLESVCQQAKGDGIIFPELSVIKPASGQLPDEPVRYIDIPGPLLQLVLPDKDELPLLANVRQSADPGTENPKFPVLICNRLPQPNQENTMFLLSLENRTDVYEELGRAKPINGEPTPTASAVLYRFVVLDTWRFASVTPEVGFEQLLVDAGSHASNTNGVLRLPPVADKDADHYLNKGYVPLEHQTRQGNKMVSWYRGPFLPGVAGKTKALLKPSTIRSPDSLVRVHADLGMFDVAYASAWNIGRSVALENKRVSQALFEWKRASVRARKADVPPHLPGKSSLTLPLPDIINDWFAGLARLEHVPFNYLVADRNLLPQDSLKFFSVDPHWVRLLMCGAFALGDIASGNGDIEDALFDQLPKPVATSGFLLRSPVVEGWPHMLVNGFDNKPPAGSNPPFEADASPLAQHRYKLGKDTLLCLFEGNIQSVEIYLHPETIHYGVDYEGAEPTQGVPEPCYFKRLRDAQGDPVQPTEPPCGSDRSKAFYKDQWVRIPFRGSGTGVIHTKGLAQRFAEALGESDMSPAHFASQMVAGVPKVRFTLNDQP